MPLAQDMGSEQRGGEREVDLRPRPLQPAWPAGQAMGLRDRAPPVDVVGLEPPPDPVRANAKVGVALADLAGDIRDNFIDNLGNSLGM